ncbi:hypothetical protein BDA96_01G202000 [Sorghum bicolor]|uniref:Late embryogenesis abundant protein LEA-2 subgroup domain-containing protein n=2 Tax=Sorghum bicolor TaxID=4558 RepID=A0A921RZ35_SORBI|nr:uncharacterized protein LOC8065681 [Sorghum bicolor]EER93927.1 hypothetical protein SORBI_3001G191800 [Sorghum bicolor]KAG0548837.1 hypothetical protein BDA96_01G202000 [Sorghum bicolor]|eukprot:XP_002466929.1 uncharacterized protein LOC8065681 [Sorghum bicolor]
MDSDAAVLPTTTTPPPPHSKNGQADSELRRRRRRRCACVCLLVSLGAALLLGITLLVLFLTVLRVRDPTTRLVSSRVIGFAPGPGPDLQFNLTMELAVDVHNPNPASFSYASGAAQLWYRGVLVGVAGVDPGRIPSKGDGTMELVMTVLSGSFGAELTQLVKDMEAGAVPLDASARVPGKVAIFGVLKLPAVAYSDCHVIFGVPEMKVQSQVCHDHTKL